MSESHQSAEVDVEILGQTIIDLEAAVEEHGQTLEVLMQLLEGAPGGPWAWDALDPASTKTLWKDLGEWVAWLERRYLANLQADTFEVPPCWYQHPVGVEMLTALMVSHQSAYNVTKTTASFELMEWHTRCLIPALEMLQRLAVYKSCLKAREHVTTLARARRHDAAAFDAFVEDLDVGSVDAEVAS